MTKIVELLTEYNSTVEKLIVAEQAASQARQLKEKAESIHKEITQELVRMDVVQRGNFGWENRIVSFLLHLFNSGKKANNVVTN